jgi:hypothetical protein
VLVTGGEEQEDFGERLRTPLEEPADPDPESGAVRLAGQLDAMSAGPEPASEPRHLGRLAGPFDALERDEDSTHTYSSATTNRSM